MTRMEYDMLRVNHPEFRLPDYLLLDEETMRALPSCPVETLVALRTITLLNCDSEQRLTPSEIVAVASEIFSRENQ